MEIGTVRKKSKRISGRLSSAHPVRDNDSQRVSNRRSAQSAADFAKIEENKMADAADAAFARVVS